ncbi:response regulator with CheY-like receiver, AAA-type ATPase, and DNA-binding domain protein [Candidatus Magnetoovum chiemensis]|nr:response regulator with CheY-like receiver, AAA-type ATPase, and DNA-binding domain protein [Candidatus Magnetoovum chiemensis]
MVRFDDKKILIIDDFKEFRQTLVKMIESMGAHDIDDSPNGDKAIEMSTFKPYDVFLCDYNLGGDKKDGQQVLEELKFRKLIKFSSVYIMVTAENTMRMVMGALEYKPDDYLTKPFTKEILKNRIVKILSKKIDFAKIEKAIQNNEYLAAIKLCDNKIEEKPGNIMEFIKLKGELLITVGDYEKAGKLYEEVLEMRNIPWATLGYGKTNYFKGNYNEAKEIFQTLIQDNQMLLEAYDWLAKCYEALGEGDLSQKVLMKGVEISPKAILRQRELGKISYKNKDYNVAEQSYKEAVNLGKTSCFKNNSDYTSLAKVHIETNSVEKALKILKEAKKEFKNKDEALIETSIVESLAYKKAGNEEEAKKSLKTAIEKYTALNGNISSHLALEMSKAQLVLGNKEEGSKLLKSVIRNNHDDEKVIKEAQGIFNEANMKEEGQEIINSTRKEIVQLNNDGVKLVQDGKLKEAIDYFDIAANALPDNKIINANAAQSILMYIQKNGRDLRMLKQAEKFLNRVRNLDPFYMKYQNLLMIYEKYMEQ